ncbi:MAG: prolyl-tRNA synthetase associated domain-containing protein [Alphaproteobacteria bacterium]|nr:prolyl-tRNA synthetase associated domain-containing protein [Alphaproteobacteria bacterium]
MPHTPDDLFAVLTQLGIRTQTVAHEAAYTVEDGKRLHGRSLPGVNVKNLFLKDAKDRLWLVSAPWERGIDLKTLPQRIGSKRLSFGSAALLMDVLGVIPGAVTPFAPINDKDKRVTVVLDAWMMRQDSVNAHPLVNTATTNIAPGDLIAFLRHVHTAPVLAELDAPL